MRWDNLFHDLETQLDAEQKAADRDRDRDRERQRFATMTWAQRLIRLSQQSEPFVCFVSGYELEVRVENHGKDWFAAEILQPECWRGFAVVPFSSVCRVELKPGIDIHVAGPVARPTDTDDFPQRLSLIERISFRIVLRDLARRRRPIRMVTDGSELCGTINRVGQDFLDFARRGESLGGQNPRTSAIEAVALTRVSFVLVEAP